MKTAAAILIVLSVISISRQAADFFALPGLIDSRQVAGLLVPFMLLIYAGTWLVALVFNTRGVIVLTAISLLIPSGLIVLNMIAIPLNEPDVSLKITITAALGACLALYVYVAWRCWVRWRTRYETTNVQHRQ